jgi:hypothetical protein
MFKNFEEFCMQVKYFVDYDGIVRDTTEPVYSCSLQALDETIILIDNDGLVYAEFQSHASLYDLEKAGVNTTHYRLNKFLKELANLNEKSAAIGAGELANIKKQA